MDIQPHNFCLTSILFCVSYYRLGWSTERESLGIIAAGFYRPETQLIGQQCVKRLKGTRSTYSNHKK